MGSLNFDRLRALDYDRGVTPEPGEIISEGDDILVSIDKEYVSLREVLNNLNKVLATLEDVRDCLEEDAAACRAFKQNPLLGEASDWIY